MRRTISGGFVCLLCGQMRRSQPFSEHFARRWRVTWSVSRQLRPQILGRLLLLKPQKPGLCALLRVLSFVPNGD